MIHDLVLRNRAHFLRGIKDPQRRSLLARVLCGLRRNINRERARAYALSGMIEYNQGMAEGWRRAIFALDHGDL